MYTFLSYAGVDLGSAMAVVAMIMTLAIILTMIFRKYVIRGLTTGAGKGTYKTYIAIKIGVSGATYHRWTQECADEAGIQIGRRAGTEIAGRCRRCDVAPQ